MKIDQQQQQRSEEEFEEFEDIESIMSQKDIEKLNHEEVDDVSKCRFCW